MAQHEVLAVLVDGAAELTLQMTDEAARTMTLQAEKTAQRLNRAA